MTKVLFNMNSLQRTVISSLDDTIQNMIVVVDKEKELSVHDDFAYAVTLKSILEEDYEALRELSKIKEWILICNKNIGSALTTIDENIKAIEQIKLNKRTSIGKK